ncbi:MAG: cardiolipin synthase [Coriobacteriia bacterium]|jgi:cardiolipin synthase|nr:cardiolipin synthase [Coriobacteriia bacterium]
MLSSLIVPASALYVLVVVVVLIYEDRDPSTTLAWLLVLLFLPVIGIPLYFFAGRMWPWRRYRKRVDTLNAAEAHRVLPAVYAAHLRWSNEQRAKYEGTDVAKIITMIERQSDGPPMPAERVEILNSGAEKFDRLIADIQAATDHVHLQYFIWGKDELTARITEALRKKVAEGVEVRIMYDFVGSVTYSKSEMKALERAGAQVKADLTKLNELNYRNHLKIAVIDGHIGYTGGMNMAQEYIDGGRRFDVWRDTHVRIVGPAVAELQRLFVARWFVNQMGNLWTERYFPVQEIEDPSSAVMLQLVHSSIGDEWEAVKQTFLQAVASADLSVRVQSPYFVPDQSFLDAMITAALGGVDLRLMMTGIPDKKIPFWAARTYLARLAAAGGRAYQYTAGFFHAKALAVDSKFCALGTTNIDVRSFALHDELMVFIYDEEITRQVEAQFEIDEVSCREVTIEELSSEGVLASFRNSVARLTSRML